MADRTSAELFGKIFDLLAKNPTEENKSIAKEIWLLQRDYDFNEYQMYCDESLIALGLARMYLDMEEGGDCIKYADYQGNVN